MSLRVEYQHKRLADLKEQAPKDPDIDVLRRVQAAILRTPGSGTESSN